MNWEAIGALAGVVGLLLMIWYRFKDTASPNAQLKVKNIQEIAIAWLAFTVVLSPIIYLIMLATYDETTIVFYSLGFTVGLGLFSILVAAVTAAILLVGIAGHP